MARVRKSTKSNAKESQASNQIKDKCPICQQDIEEAAITQCEHIFCYECLIRWMSYSGPNSMTCPSCRGDISKREQLEIMRHLGKGEDMMFLVRLDDGRCFWLFKEFLMPSSLIEEYNKKLAARRRSQRLNINYNL